MAVGEPDYIAPRHFFRLDKVIRKDKRKFKGRMVGQVNFTVNLFTFSHTVKLSHFDSFTFLHTYTFTFTVHTLTL